ncbi:MAG TPA: phosphoadenylyl-sulfate reductase [Planctomycetota bacterium]|nr:phosphoadenylyl-sulfate reductase [Planctomycetota bacterium]
MASSTGKRFSAADIAALNDKFERATPQDVLAWALKELGSGIALAWSGAEDVAVLDMMWRIDKNCRVFTLDTGRLNPETYELIDKVSLKYSLKVEVMFPQTAAVEKMVAEKGINLFYESLENRKLCCGVRKVEPLNRMLGTLDGWITGLRRTQAVTRGKLSKLEIDADHGGILKLNPLADWTTQQVFDYMKANGVPKNKLHEQGYPSIGCAPCTRAVKPGEDERAGRWWWENPEHKECGLHVKAKS